MKDIKTISEEDNDDEKDKLLMSSIWLIWEIIVYYFFIYFLFIRKMKYYIVNRYFLYMKIQLNLQYIYNYCILYSIKILLFISYL